MAKVIFAGTPPFAVVALEALVRAEHEILLVLTQPDRPAGRGMLTRPSAVKQFATAHRMQILQPDNLRDPSVQERLKSIGADVMVVAAYGLILPSAVLAIPPRGCLNIHASLLPRWRGAAPIQRALLAGDRETGITIMQMDEGLDTGAILLRRSLVIDEQDTAETLHDRLARLGGESIVAALSQRALPQPQDANGICYAAKISKSESIIDWGMDANHICRQVRAYNPVPGAVTTLSGLALKIWRTQPANGHPGRPGIIMAASSEGIVVAAGKGAVCITELQKAGGRRIAAGPFLAGFEHLSGMQLGK